MSAFDVPLLRVIGISWFREEDYAAFRAVSEDGRGQAQPKGESNSGRTKVVHQSLAIVAGVDNCWPVPLRLQPQLDQAPDGFGAVWIQCGIAIPLV
jgi:hypothetical protein